jgi:tetratricopeptide (TPR) repeat protein
MEDTNRTHGASSMTGETPGPKPALSVPLQGADSFHLRVAEGWIGLGDYAAAGEQLKNISSETWTHPAVQKVRWQICVNAKNWGAALDVASALVRLDPKESLGWTRLSYALHALKRTAEARDNLLRVIDTFSDNATMRYNLACYESQLGRMEEAKSWLVEAFKLGGKRRMKQMALADSDLEPLREWIPLVSTLSGQDLNDVPCSLPVQGEMTRIKHGSTVIPKGIGV